MSWLIDRAFNISKSQKINESDDKKLIASNKALLVKVLYDTNSKEFLKCLSKNAKKQWFWVRLKHMKRQEIQ